VPGRTYGGKTEGERAADRRRRLLAAGLRHFAARGAGTATITGISRDAGVTARHFYEQFASIEELLLATYEQILDRHRGSVAAALAQAPEDDLELRVRAAIGAAVRAWTADRASAKVAFVEVVGHSARVEARRLRAIEEYTLLVLAVSDDLHRRGLAPAPGRRLAARALVGALIGLVELWLTDPDPPDPDAMIGEASVMAIAALQQG
jgi:AcrR family transcriptional regulator